MIAGRITKVSVTIAFLMLLMIGLSVKGSRAQEICPGESNAFPIGVVNLNITPNFADFVAADLFIAERLADGTVTGGVDWLYASLFSFANPLGPFFPGIIIGTNGLTVQGSLVNTTITGSQLVSKYNQTEGRNTYVEVANSARGICKYDRPFLLGGFPQECDSQTPNGPSIDCLPTTNHCDEGTGHCTIGDEVCSDDFDCAICQDAHGTPLVEVHVEVLDETCTEVCDFCDSYTPLDKHVYDLGNLVRNRDGTAVPCRDQIQDHEGFLTVTAVKDCVENVSHQAIDFNYLFGDMTMHDPRIDVDYGENLQTRLALSLRGTCKKSSDECIVGSAFGMTLPVDPCPGDNCEGAILGLCQTTNPSAGINGTGQCFDSEDCGGANCVSTPIGPPTMGTCSLSDVPCQPFIPDSDGYDACADNNGCILDGSGCAGHCLDGDLGCELVSYVPQFLRKDFSIIPGNEAGADLVKLAFTDTYGTPGNGFRYLVAPGSVTYGEGIFDDEEHTGSCGSQTACYDRVGLNDDLPLIESPNPIIATPTPTPTPECTSDADCPFPEVCNLMDNTCEPQACTSDTDCPDGAVCDVDVCVAGCRDDAGCPSGEVCVDIDPSTGIGMCASPTPTPTATPTPTGTPTPTPRSGNFGSSGSCTSVAGAAPVQLGTAMANILIPLVPALAVGFGALRRKRKKGQKK